MRVLVTSPELDNITRYLRAWTQKLVQEFENRHTIFHVDYKKVRNKYVCGLLQKRAIELVCLNGHGNDRQLGGHDNEIIIDEKNVHLLKGTTVHALACNTAKTLGPLAMKAGAKGYIGYDARFILLSRPNSIAHPLQDDVAALFLNPAFTAPRALLAGKTCDEAVAAAQEAYRRSIKEALNSDIQSDKDKCVQYLLWNMKRLKSCAGE